MYRITLGPALIVIAGSSFVGCAPRYSEHSVGNGGVATLSYQADWRAATILYRSSETVSAKEAVAAQLKIIKDAATAYSAATAKVDREQKKKLLDDALDGLKAISASTSVPYVLSEPPPQMANEFTIKLEGKFDKVDIGELSFGSTAAKMFEVNGYNLAIRDALYRLNEAHFYKPFDGNNYESMFKAVLEAATKMADFDTRPDKEVVKQALRAAMSELAAADAAVKVAAQETTDATNALSSLDPMATEAVKTAAKERVKKAAEELDKENKDQARANQKVKDVLGNALLLQAKDYNELIKDAQFQSALRLYRD